MGSGLLVKIWQAAPAFWFCSVSSQHCHNNPDAGHVSSLYGHDSHVGVRLRVVVASRRVAVWDVVHYLRDAERGVVWEESIILAPKGCRMAFLSATIPNTTEFAGWVAATHQSPPLLAALLLKPKSFHAYLPLGLCLYAKDLKTSQMGCERCDIPPGPGSDIFKLVTMVMTRGFDPFIVFSFSKRECESLALGLSGLDLNSDTEKQLVEGIYSEEDQRLPQIGALLPMLKRGIGVHHSGLLPILKELVELLFQ
eukprot:gene14149-14286_t